MFSRNPFFDAWIPLTALTHLSALDFTCIRRVTKGISITCTWFTWFCSPFFAHERESRLLGILKLFNVKAKNGRIDKNFTKLLELLSDMLTEGNMMPTCNYDAKKLLSNRFAR